MLSRGCLLIWWLDEYRWWFSMVFHDGCIQKNHGWPRPKRASAPAPNSWRVWWATASCATSQSRRMSRRASGARTRHQIPWHGMDGKMGKMIRTGTYWEFSNATKVGSGRDEVISMFCYVLFIFSNYTALCFLIRSAERGISYMFGRWIWSNDFNRRFDAEQPSNEFRRWLERENLWPPR